MLGRFVLWFIYFGLSFLVEGLGWAEQGKAFMYIDIGIDVLFLLIHIAIDVYEHFAESSIFLNHGDSFQLAFAASSSIALLLLVTWGVTKLFNVDFYVAYQILMIGRCLYAAPKSKK